LGPIVAGLAEKLGLSPQIAQMVVTFVLSKLLSGHSSKAGVLADEGQPGLDLDHLMERMGSGEGLDAGYFESTGMTQELAEQTGLDPDTAARSLQEVFGALGGGAAPAPPEEPAEPDLSGLGGLLQDL
jgi:hypothetical protein